MAPYLVEHLRPRLSSFTGIGQGTGRTTGNNSSSHSRIRSPNLAPMLFIMVFITVTSDADFVAGVIKKTFIPGICLE